MKIKNTDYSYMFWNHGFRGKSPDGKRVMSIQAGSYGCAFDTRMAGLLNYGPYTESPGAEDALVAELCEPVRDAHSGRSQVGYAPLVRVFDVQD